MQSNDLAGMVQRLLKTGEPQELDKQQLREFHANFRREVAPLIDDYRERQRRAGKHQRCTGERSQHRSFAFGRHQVLGKQGAQR